MIQEQFLKRMQFLGLTRADLSRLSGLRSKTVYRFFSYECSIPYAKVAQIMKVLGLTFGSSDTSIDNYPRRFYEILQEKGVTLSTFSRASKMNPSTARNILIKGGNFSSNMLERILETLNLNIVVYENKPLGV